MNTQKQALHYLKLSRYIREVGQSNDYRKLPRPFFSIALIEKGCADFITDEGKFSVQEGELLFTPAGATYRSFWRGDPKTQILSCHFRFSPSAEPFRGKQFPLQKLSGSDTLRSDVLYLYENIGKPSAAFSVISRFYALCDQVTQTLSYREIPDIDPRIARAVSYLEEHYAEQFSVPSLAGLCNVSPSYFYDLFRTNTGFSPIEYKQRICIRHAELLLCDEPSLSIEQISEAVGFESSNYFRRVFRACTGSSPREYRKTASASV